ncbi:hypothetical protein SAMN05421780_101453 [Flexibacter flexilis DSM 6793]|uniref:FtsX-like permease family protein n=1 Tax=Flexibacter flexilis DSM 6793 TaxID=927664 RepID=A0A1I1DYV8_9BACT|nr:ABC transporter permease [Flexibacter flexilis]SFB78178.1 hypothetical protein SAMN05421780_101453 [Flexibacter flexilis DSM 6793]
MHWLLTKIIWQNKSKWQLFLAAAGFVAGLVIMLVAVQIYWDIEAALQPQKNKSGRDFLILNKEIGLANTLKLASSQFTQNEIDSLKNQPFVTKIGLFTSNQFESYLEASSLIPFKTNLFFEAVPDDFLDVVPSQWVWDEHSDFVPIMMSQDFINLYNFGYAPSQGLPQIPKESVTLLPLTLRIAGKGGERVYDAQIVGFSDRISSVLVPERFMVWANEHIGQSTGQQPSRLIVETPNASDAAVADYLKKHGYVTNQDKLRASQTNGVLRVIMSLVGLLGAFFIALSVVIFLMNFRLIIAEAKEEIRLLLQLGYKVKTLSFNMLLYFSVGLLVASGSAMVIFTKLIASLHAFVSANGLPITTDINSTVWTLAAVLVAGCWAVSSLSVWRLLRVAAQ